MLGMENQVAVHQLRALWSLHALGATDEAFLITVLRHPDEHLRTWAVRLMTDDWALDKVVEVASSDPVRRITSSPGLARLLAQQARTDTSGLVRLALANDFAKATKLHRKLYPIFKTLFIEPNPVPIKVAVLRAGIIASAEVREPLCDMSAANAQLLEKALAALGK